MTNAYEHYWNMTIEEDDTDGAQNSMERGTDERLTADYQDAASADEHSRDMDTAHTEGETEQETADDGCDCGIDDMSLDGSGVTDRDRFHSLHTMGDPGDYPSIERLLDDVGDHGEVHATVEEHDDELEIRKGTTLFDFDAGVLRIDTPSNYGNLVVSMDHVVDWYRPYEAWH